MNKISTRWKASLSIAAMLILSVVASLFYQQEHFTEVKNSYEKSLPPADLEKNPLEYIKDDFTVDAEFSSHLPIVILDTGGETAPITMKQTKEGIFVPIEGIEPYIDGTFRILHSETGRNTLTDKPSQESKIKIKRRGNTSMLYDKAQWLIKMQTATGEQNEVDLLNMGANDEWILNGSVADKSMLRNYLVYSLTSEIMPYTPDSHFCEVLIKNKEGYQYEGVYLLQENIIQGPDRVDIAPYKRSAAVNSYLVRRDRIDIDKNMLKTKHHGKGEQIEYFGLLYPSKYKVTEEMIDYVSADVNLMEDVLYAEDFNIFSTYPQYIDVDSFVNYFLINEFFGSYDAGNYSTYFYKDLGGKITMGPVWDFDNTMDNFNLKPMEIEHLGFQIKPWFQQLCRDKAFIHKLEKQYAALRRSTFSETHVINKIDEIVAYLGGARQREWKRWEAIYTGNNTISTLRLDPYKDKDGDLIQRYTMEYEHEINRIKTMLRKHANEMPYQFKILEKRAEVSTDNSHFNGILLFLCSMVFIVPAVYVGFKK
ncbi:MAG: CotH kinase family protein [Lachnospiraceae bacterium]